MGKDKKISRNRFTKSARLQFIKCFINQSLNLTQFLKHLNINKLNVDRITYSAANRWLASENIPNRPTKSAPISQVDRFKIV